MSDVVHPSKKTPRHLFYIATNHLGYEPKVVNELCGQNKDMTQLLLDVINWRIQTNLGSDPLLMSCLLETRRLLTNENVTVT